MSYFKADKFDDKHTMISFVESEVGDLPAIIWIDDCQGASFDDRYMALINECFESGGCDRSELGIKALAKTINSVLGVDDKVENWEMECYTASLKAFEWCEQCKIRKAKPPEPGWGIAAIAVGVAGILAAFSKGSQKKVVEKIEVAHEETV
jgi:hypothetical protein